MPHMTGHLWYPNGLEVNRKWTGCDWKWIRSVHLSVRTYVHPKHFPYLLDKPYVRDLQAQGDCTLQFFLKKGVNNVRKLFGILVFVLDHDHKRKYFSGYFIVLRICIKY